MPSIDELYEQVVKAAHENVNKLNKKLEEIEKVHQDIKKLLEQNEKMPGVFDKKFSEILIFENKFIEELGGATKVYLDGSNEILTQRLLSFSEKIEELKIEITRLVETDFHKLFESLQKEFMEQTTSDFKLVWDSFDKKFKEFDGKLSDLKLEIDRLVNTDFNKLFRELQEAFINQTRLDLENEYKKLDEKSQGFQENINVFEAQVKRLENIDLEKHFEKHQKTLSDIFGALNNLNVSFSSAVERLNTIIQSLGEVQNQLRAFHNETTELITKNHKEALTHLDDLQKMGLQNFEKVNEKMKTIEGYNIQHLKNQNQLQIIVVSGLSALGVLQFLFWYFS